MYFTGVDGNSIHFWIFPPRKKTNSKKIKASVLQFHGNAENMTSHYLSLLWLLDHNYELITFDYRGYGKSEGSPDTKKIIEDSQKFITFLQKRNNKWNRPIIIFGQSLGGILSTRSLAELENKELIYSLVIEASFSSYEEIGETKGREICLPLGYLASLLISDKYSIQKELEKISPIPIIIIHGTKDKIIPLSFSQKIYELAKEPKYFIKIPLAQHLNWHLFQENSLNLLSTKEKEQWKIYQKHRKKLLHLLDTSLKQP